MANGIPRNPKPVWISAILCFVLLIVFFCLQSRANNLLALPVQYLILAASPVIVGLIVGGYLTSVKAGDYGIEFSSEVLEKSQEIENPKTAPKGALQSIPAGAWQLDRAKEYDRTKHYMLAHIYRPSEMPGQKYDVSIFIVRHEKGTTKPPRKNFDEVSKAEFFFGESWGNRVFAVTGEDGFFGVRTHAWGTFLALCRISFKSPQQEPIVLYRYVDFSMLTETEQTLRTK